MSTMTVAAEPQPVHLQPTASVQVDGLLEILTFALGSEEYGVDILQVQEIRGYTGVTRLPDTPAWMKGVINLRGTIVPVLDLRLKLGRGQPNYDTTTVMVIVNIGGRVIGLVVDAVSDVTRLEPAQIRPAPSLGSAVDERLIRGIASVADRMIILFDMNVLLDGALDAATQATLRRELPAVA